MYLSKSFYIKFGEIIFLLYELGFIKRELWGFYTIKPLGIKFLTLSYAEYYSSRRCYSDDWVYWGSLDSQRIYTFNSSIIEK